MNGRVQRYTCSQHWKKNQTLIIIKPDVVFRPDRIMTNLEREGQAFLDAIYINDSEDSELMGRVDLYYFSIKHQDELRKAFYEEHNLVGKSLDEIQDYLDENELEEPGPMRLMLPAGSKYRFSGFTSVDFNVVLIGTAVVRS